MTSILKTTAVIWGFGLVIACSSGANEVSPDGGQPSGSLGGSGGMQPAGGHGGGSAGSATPATGSDPHPLEPPEDWVGNIVAQRTRAFGADKSEVYIDFAKEGMEAYEAAVGGVTSTCTTTKYGACKRTVCVYETPGPGTISLSPDMLPPVVQLEAGTIHVTAGGSFSAVGQPDSESELYDATSTGSLAGGETLNISASGGSVEGFAATLLMPFGPRLLSPPAPAGATGVVKVPVSKGDDLAITWDARDAAQSVWLVTRMPKTVDFSFTCRFDAAIGTGTVTRDALAGLPSGTELHLFAENYTTLETADGTILIEALGELLSSDQTGYPLLLVQ